ncbi:MAG: cell envelope integrity protein TolA [Comamonadaceae bacterium]|nr:MAG: cell envelope integrity protein TolA [Comamonadaceae bacterium]
MPSAADRIDFSPPPPKGSIRAFGLALLAHCLLIAALTWGVNWKTSDDSSAPFAAELWTSAPMQDAVPRPPAPVAVPVPVPQPAPTPEPTPTPPPKVVETPVTPDVDIALEQEKKRKQEREQKVAAEKAAKEKLEKAREQAAAEEARAERIAKAEKAKADAAKALQAKQLAAAKAAKEADAKKLQAQKDTKAADVKEANAKAAADKLRQENLKRMQGMAGATGETEGNSNSKATAGGRGSSRTYAAIASAAIRKNVVFIDDTYGNPVAKVEVRITSDGTIISQRIVQASGNKAWDDAALNAVVRTRVMPRDVDGGFPDSILILEMRPRG